MNAAIRAVVRHGAALGVRVTGVRRGYCGVLHGDYLLAGRHGVMAAMRNGRPLPVSLEDVVRGRRALDPALHALAESLSL